MIERFTQPATAGFGTRYVEPGAIATVILDGAAEEHRWGVLAPWRGHGGVRPPPIRLATLASLAMIPVLRKATRCLVPAVCVLAKTKAGSKTRVWQLVAGVDAMLFAGVTATHKDDGVPSFALLTVPAPLSLATYSDVVPALADEAWLQGGEPIDRPWRALDPSANPDQGELF